MNTGTLIAIVIALLIVLAIWWFMTRAGRQRAQARYRDDARHRTAAAASDDTNVTASMGAATAPTTVPRGVGADALQDAASTDRSAGLTSASAAVAGVAAGAAVASAAGSTSPSSAESVSSGSFQAPDVPLAHTDGNLRSQGGGGSATDATVDGVADDRDAQSSEQTPEQRANAPAVAAAGQFDGYQRGGNGTMPAPSMGALPSAQPALDGDFTVDTGDAVRDIREMMKILNLRASEAQRLQVSGDEFAALWHGQDGSMDGARLNDVAARLRHMLR